MVGDLLFDKVVLGNQVLVHNGLIAPFGHLSTRIPGRDEFYILGHKHGERRYSNHIRREDIVKVSLEGKIIDGSLEPPGETAIHAAIYRARSDVKSVAHVHPKYSIALSVCNQEILPVWAAGSIFAPRVPIVPYAGQIESLSEAERLLSVMGKGMAVVLRGHGVVVAGSSVEEACVVTITLEQTAELQVLVKDKRILTMDENELPPGYAERLLTGEYVESLWQYHISQIVE